MQSKFLVGYDLWDTVLNVIKGFGLVLLFPVALPAVGVLSGL